MKVTKPTLYLIGDSIIDNGTYVGFGQPDVAMQIQELAPEWHVAKLAVDGHTTREVLKSQLFQVKAPSAPVVLSVGGNDALRSLVLFEDDLRETFLQSMLRYSTIVEGFRSRYSTILDTLLKHTVHVMPLTIYRPRFQLNAVELRQTYGVEVKELQAAADAALSAFNDVITEEAMARKLRVFDLRQHFRANNHYANSIEPSVLGGSLIAEQVKDWIETLAKSAEG